jgi:glucose-1-phosphate cytidylyltransferase
LNGNLVPPPAVTANGHGVTELTSAPLELPRVIILASGAAGRLADSGADLPKTMVQVGDRPLLWHVMHCFGRQGCTDFVIAAGDRYEPIERYLLDSVTGGALDPSWTVQLIEAGAGDEVALSTTICNGTSIIVAGDVISDVNLDALLAFHREHGRLGTAVAVRPPARFGRLEIAEGRVVDFAEKPQHEEAWVAGGILILGPGVFDFVVGDGAGWETHALQRLAEDGELVAYNHGSFWKRLETLRDRQELEGLWQSGAAPWR